MMLHKSVSYLDIGEMRHTGRLVRVVKVRVVSLKEKETLNNEISPWI